MDRLYAGYSLDRLSLDPLELVRRYENPADQEVAGFIAAMLAIGRADLIRKATGAILEKMGPSPAKFVRRYDPDRDGVRFRGFVYRFFNEHDTALLIFWMRSIILEFGSMGVFFRSGYNPSDPDIGPALSRFVQSILKLDVPKQIRSAVKKGSGLRHFLADPAEGSACKRLNLYLRWMVRKDKLDLGVWTGISHSKLVIPLDTHIARLGKKLRLTRRSSPDWKMALEITESLRRFDPDDPVKYDFALCTVGKLHACPKPFEQGKCQSCPLILFCGGNRI
jgi:uncharacterized protein (TIGR02757 family)